MSYCEDYFDPFDREDESIVERDEEDDDEHWTCLYPDKCLMPALHCRDGIQK